MTHEEIVKRCLELDEMKGLIIRYITSDRYTYQLIYQSTYWGMLAENERYCMVKYGNYYLTEEAAKAAIARAAKYVEEDEDVLESNYMSYLEAGGSGEPLSFEEWKKTQ